MVRVGSENALITVDYRFENDDNFRLDVDPSKAYGTITGAALSIPASKIVGYVSKSNGVLAGGLRADSVTWSPVPGVTVTGPVGISPSCGLQPETLCPDSNSATGPFITVSSARVQTSYGSGTVSGGVSLDGRWVRLNATGTGSYPIAGVTTVVDPALTIWKGARSDRFDPNLQLPDLSSLNSGMNMEFCGSFTMAVPMLKSNAATKGCARSSPRGIVVGQVASAPGGIGAISASAGTQGASTTAMSGVVWTNISASSTGGTLPSATLFGTPVQLVTGTVAFAGSFALPAKASAELGMGNPVVSVTGTSNAAGVAATGYAGAGFSNTEAPVAITTSGFALNITVTPGGTWSATGSKTTVATVGYPGVAVVPIQFSVTASASSSKPASFSATSTTGPPAWSDAFGVKGFDLNSLQATFSRSSNLLTVPSLGMSNVSYSFAADVQARSTGQPGLLAPGSTIKGAINVSGSQDKSCIAAGFDSGSPQSGISIAGGAMVAQRFTVAVNSLETKCSAQADGETKEIPANFKGVQFSAGLGDSSFNFGVGLAGSSWAASASATNMKLGGTNFSDVALQISKDSASSTSKLHFDATMETSAAGTFYANVDVSKTTAGQLHLLLKTWGRDLKLHAPSMTITEFGFNVAFDVGGNGNDCFDFTAAAWGKATGMGDTNAYSLKDARLAIHCNTITLINFELENRRTLKGGDHGTNNGTTLTSTLAVQYRDKDPLDDSRWPSEPFGSLWGKRTFKVYASQSFTLGYSRRGMDRRIKFSGSLAFGARLDDLYFVAMGTITAAADRVSGTAQVSADSSGNFGFHLDLRVNPSFAGVWHHGWDV